LAHIGIDGMLYIGLAAFWRRRNRMVIFGGKPAPRRDWRLPENV